MSSDKTKSELMPGDKHATPDVLAWMLALGFEPSLDAWDRPSKVIPHHIPSCLSWGRAGGDQGPSGTSGGVPAAAGEARARRPWPKRLGKRQKGPRQTSGLRPVQRRGADRPGLCLPRCGYTRQAGHWLADHRQASRQTAGSFRDAHASCQGPLVFPQSPQALRDMRNGARGIASLEGAGVLVLAAPSHARTRGHAPWRALPASGRLTVPAPAVRSAGRPPGAYFAGSA